MKTCLRLLILSVIVVAGGHLGLAEVRNFKPVTEAMLLNPDPADWLHWRRTLDGWGYSPLTQINRQNAQQLQLAWSHPLIPGVSETTPLVHDGVMYISKPMSASGVGGVQALDAVTGEQLWEYRKDLEAVPAFDGRMRSLAIYGDKIFLNTPDAHIVALDARTGTVVWDHTVASYKLGYRYTSGPIIVKGKVVSGMTGCDKYKNDVCFISAHDTETGREVWRTATIARPGTPGGDTWGDLPLTFRAGGDAWIPGSFDPKTNLTYWSTAQAKPWARISRGTDGDVLFTNSVLALDPESGKVMWYRQLIQGETHDQDEVFESVLIDRDGRSSLFKMGKLGILWEIDRKNGDFVAAHDLGYQSIVNLDPKTGKIAYKQEMIPKAGVPITFCPGLGGIKNWRAMAYAPETQTLIIPLSLYCQRSVFSEVAKVEGGGGNSIRPYAGEVTEEMFPHPVSPDSRGRLISMDIRTGRVLWEHISRRGPTTAALTTAGGLAIVADGEPSFKVLDAANGTLLFESKLVVPASGFPITYSVRGKQYIAVPSGNTTAGVSVYALQP